MYTHSGWCSDVPREAKVTQQNIYTHEPLRKFTVKQTLLFEPRFSQCRCRLCFSRKKRLPP